MRVRSTDKISMVFLQLRKRQRQPEQPELSEAMQGFVFVLTMDLEPDDKP